MIIVQLTNGLGNQLFQYAAALKLASRHGTPLRLDISHFSSCTDRRYGLDAYPLSQDIATEQDICALRPRSRIIRRLRRELGICNKCYHERQFNYDPHFESLGPDTYLVGYFQSQRYFKGCEERIRSLFVPHTTPDGAALRDIRQAKAPVAVHVRRGDYAQDRRTNAYHGTMPLEYYAAAMELLSRKLWPVCPTFFLFSDDPRWVAEHFAVGLGIVPVEGDTDRPQGDLWLMSQCHHHILANSSFSWWGAWLGVHPNKSVIAPRQWFSPQEMLRLDTRDLFPDGWIVL